VEVWAVDMFSLLEREGREFVFPVMRTREMEEGGLMNPRPPLPPHLP